MPERRKDLIKIIVNRYFLNQIKTYFDCNEAYEVEKKYSKRDLAIFIVDIAANAHNEISI